MNEANDDPGATIRGADDPERTRPPSLPDSSVPVEEAITVAGGYRLVKMLGRGGMGAVYLARQGGLERDVAVKTILPAFKGHRAVENLFLDEAQVTGGLEHPGIVPVHELGRTPDGLAYMSMKLVRGVEWAKLIAAPDTGLRAHLEILLKVCDAVAFANAREVLHRDLKPANVMVGEFGEVQVMDWGIALKLSQRAAVKSPAGTPAYMAPELARPEPDRMGPASDVYLLGAILYEVLTGTPPHRGGKTPEVLARACAGTIEPPEVRAPDRRVPAELARVALKALASEPADRYPTALAFASAIRDYLAHEESLKLAEGATADLARLEQKGAVPASERYATWAGALSRLAEALHLWPGNEDAARAQARAALGYADEALERGDAGLAAAQMPLIAAHPHADAGRRDALAAALAKGASAARRTRVALALSVVIAVALYGALGGAWKRVAAAERREHAAVRLGATLEQAWQAVRAGDLVALGGATATLDDPEIKDAAGFAERLPALRYAHAILLWQRGRFEELGELVARHGALPPLPARPKVKRRWNETDWKYFPPLVMAMTMDPPMLTYISAGIKNGRTGELLAQLGRAAALGATSGPLDRALDAVRELVQPDRASPEQRRWYALGVAAVRGQAYRAALDRGDPDGAKKLEAACLPFLLKLAAKDPVSVPSNIGFDTTPMEWSLLGSKEGRAFHLRVARRAPLVAAMVPGDDGSLFALTDRAALRVNWSYRQVAERLILPGNPVLAWPDPVDRATLVVLIGDDAPADNPAIKDRAALDRFLAGGALLPVPAGARAPSGAVRQVTLAPGAMPAPPADVVGTLEAIQYSTANPDLFEGDKDPVFGRTMSSVLSHAGQDRTDVNAPLTLLVRHRKELPPGIIAYLMKRLEPAARRLVSEDAVQAAVLLERAGFPAEAIALLKDAAARFDGNPHLASGSPTDRLLALVAARDDAFGQAAREAARAFAVPDATVTPLAARLSRWRTGGQVAAVAAALATLALMAWLARRARASRLADLHGQGWRTWRERTLAYLTHPFARARHVWAAYATRPQRLAVALAGAAFLIALGVSATAHRLERELAVLTAPPGDRLLAEGDVVRLLEERRGLGSRDPVLLRVLAAAHRARGELAEPADPAPVRLAELHAAALDPVALEHAFSRALVFTVFEPGALAVPGALVLGGALLAAFWLPLAVRPLHSRG